jgi:hypothetical protein
MIQSDALSRRPNFYLDGDDDNTDVTLLPDNLFVNLIDLDLQRRIAESGTFDSTAADAIKLLLDEGPSAAKSDLSDWAISHVDEKPILFYRDKCYVPQDLPVRREIVARYHDAPTAGHPGELETYNALRTHYWWPGMRTFVKNYVKGCAFCQQFKINRHPTKPALLPISGPVSTRPFAHLSVDFITDLPPVRGLDSILSVVDHGLTKGIILVPCSKLGATADATATLILDNVFKRFGLPDKILSDCGPQFASGMFRELMKKLGIQTALSTAYHPQTDGTTEHFNQEIEAYLSIYCTSHPEDWVDALPILEFTHNN